MLHNTSYKCSLHYIVAGGWTDWTLWSVCSATCDNGQTSRQRFCARPSPANGGLNCPGPSTEQKACKVANCPGKFINSGNVLCVLVNNTNTLNAYLLSGKCFSVSGAVAGPTSYTIRFTHVLTNIGSQYSTSTGVFTCQFSGLYAFTLTIITDRGFDNAYCTIRKNGSRIYGEYSGTAFVVLHLVHGDKVDVGHCSPLANIHRNNDTSSFSGFLIKAD